MRFGWVGGKRKAREFTTEGTESTEEEGGDENT
jgi:hypothetical protein